MKIEFLTGYLEKNQRNSGSLEIYYDFIGMSGLFVPNQVYKGENQFYNIGGGFGVNGQFSPGIFSSSYQESGFTGSGVFDGTTNLRVINQLTGNSLSLFYNFSSYSCAKSFNIGAKSINIPTGYIQVLSYIESKTNSTPFEIILGINDAYKLTLEFSGTTGQNNEIYKSVNLSELSLQNPVGLRLNKDRIEYTYFDIIEDEINNEIISLTGDFFSQSKNIYIGNFPTGKSRVNYTGLIGIVDDFIACDEYFDASLSMGLTKLFIKTGESIEIRNITGVKYNVIQSGFLNPTGIIGTGITGYRIVPSEDSFGSTTIYISSGVSGLLTGEKIEYRVVSQEQYAVKQQIIQTDLFDENYASRFTKNYIIFTPKIDSTDIFEVQLYQDSQSKIEYPEYGILNSIYVPQDNLANKNVLIFFNGINISSGDYKITSNGNKFTISSYNKDINDTVSYILSSQTGFENYTYNNTTGSVYNGYVFVGKLNSKKYDIFLNGQKLISGENYIISGSNRDLYLKTDLAPGEVYAYEDNFLSGTTGTNIKLYSPNINYNNEKIWVNGLFQNKNENYILTSCINTVLHATGDIEVKGENIFNNEYHRFI
jgi:hypothetical protein